MSTGLSIHAQPPTRSARDSQFIRQSKAAARAAKLRYVTGDGPGIVRLRNGRGFRYRTTSGRPVRDASTLARIRALVLPPAWTDVWICPHPDGHLQATGHDARGRKQYRYHADFRQKRDEAKYGRLALFGSALPRIRGRLRRDLALPGVPRNKVLATIVKLMEKTFLRVGNEEYARTNGSFGLTTLRDHHVRVTGETIRFCFRGKSGVWCEVDVNDARLAKMVRRCRDLPGRTLFQYHDEHGRRRAIRSSDVNAYLREISGRDFTAKDFRTWAGTLWAVRCSRDLEPPQTQREAKSQLVQVVRSVSERLGNTEAVCRKCYIHPTVLESIGDPTFVKLFAAGTVAKSRRAGGRASLEKQLVRYIRTHGGRRAA